MNWHFISYTILFTFEQTKSKWNTRSIHRRFYGRNDISPWLEKLYRLRDRGEGGRGEAVECLPWTLWFHTTVMFGVFQLGPQLDSMMPKDDSLWYTCIRLVVVFSLPGYTPISTMKALKSLGTILVMGDLWDRINQTKYHLVHNQKELISAVIILSVWKENKN